MDSERVVEHVFVYAEIAVNLTATTSKHIAFRRAPQWNIQLRFGLTKNLRDTMAASHDSHYKLLFSHPELVHDLLVEFVSVWSGSS